MGSTLVVREHPYCSRSDLSKWVADIQRSDAYESGNLYSGCWNMADGLCFIETKIFESAQAAENEIREKHSKYEPLWALPAMQEPQLDYSELIKDPKYGKLLEQRKQLVKFLNQQNTSIVERAKAGKSLFKGCTECESKISVKHVRSVSCPVCGSNLLRTASDDKTKAAWELKLVALDEALKAREKVLAQKANLGGPVKVWVVGGWCSS